MAIWRLTTSGDLDTSGFKSSHGYFVQHNAGGGNGGDTGFDIKVDIERNIVLDGYSENASAWVNMIVWKLTDAGVFDTTFGSNGWISVNFTSAASGRFGQGMAIDSAGRIVVAGYGNPTGNDGMFLWRLK